MNVNAVDFALHVLGGYRLNHNQMLAWNITYVRSENDTTRAGTVSGHFATDTALLTGVWYTNVALTNTAYVSLGLDYTLQLTFGGKFTESDGTQLANIKPDKIWQGDFTASALFVQPLDSAELFLRVGGNIDTLNLKRERFVDVPIDVGAAVRIKDTFALVGSVGATVLRQDFMELRGAVRFIGRL